MKKLIALIRHFLFYVLLSMIFASPVFAVIPGKLLPGGSIGSSTGGCTTGAKSFRVICGTGTVKAMACGLKENGVSPVKINLQALRQGITYLSKTGTDNTAGDDICDDSNTVSLKRGTGIYYINIWTTQCGVTTIGGKVACLDNSNNFKPTTLAE